MSTDTEVTHDFSEIEKAHKAAQDRLQENHNADLEARLAPARSQARLDEAQAEAVVLKAQGDRRLKSGGAIAAGFVGIAAIVAAASLWRRVEVVHDAIVTEKVVTVDRPVVTEKVVTVDRVVEKPVPYPVSAPAAAPVEGPKPSQRAAAPAPPPINSAPPPTAANDLTPEPGDQMTPSEFKQTEMFRTAEKCRGRLVSHVRGVLKFEDGSQCFDATPEGTVDPRLTTARHDGDVVVCNNTGNIYPSGKPEKSCYALHNGRVERIEDMRRTAGGLLPSVQGFEDIFN